jgi:hypothetical protein
MGSLGRAQLADHGRDYPVRFDARTRNEAAPAVDTASAGLQRVARFLVFCAVAGRCLLLEANHCVTFEGSGVERIESKLRDSNASVKWFVFPARTRTLAVVHNKLQEKGGQI